MEWTSFSIAAPTDFCEYKGGRILNDTFDPSKFGISKWSGDDLYGGEASENHAILKRIFEGEKSAYRDAVTLNGGVMIYLAGLAESIKEGISKAAQAIDSRAASEKTQSVDRRI